MAKKISDELIGLKIVINGDEAQAKITQLTAKNNDLNISLSEQEKILNNLKKANEGQKDALDRVQQSIDKYNTKIEHNNTLAKQEIEILRNKQKAYAEGSAEYIRYQSQIDKLQSKTEAENRKIALSISDLEKKQAQLNAEYKRSEDNIKTYAKVVADLNEEISANKKEIDELTKGMDTNSLTMEQLRKRANDLRYALNNMNPNSATFAQTQQELAEVNGRMSELRAGSQGASNSIGNLADKFNRYSGMAAAAVATFTGVAISIQQTIDMNNKLADAQSAVAKTTGLTKREVKELTDSFSDFDTRSSKMDLLKISEIGGRLGVPKDEILNFTKEIDKAYVALGDSFSGGVEKVAEKLGKIKGLFKETKDLDISTAINQIGSSMNELGANGAASEENIAEFATRVGSMPEKLKPTVAEALALGAAFEESGIDAERSATAYSNFLKVASNNTERFAYVMGISQDEVKKLINTDPTAFFLKFSEGMKGMEATDIAQTLDYLKLNDQYVTSILSAAADNTDRFRKTIDLSNDSLLEATSLQKEFNEVNNNAAAIYDKVAKKFIGMLSSDTVAQTLNWLISTFGKFIGAIEDTEGTITGFRNTLIFLFKIIAVGATAFYSYNAAIYLNTQIFTAAKAQLLGYTIAQKVHTAWTKLSTIALTLWNTVVGLGAQLIGRLALATGAQTLATNMQTIAQTKLNAAMAMNPYGAILALITAVVAALYLFSDATEDASNKTKAYAEANAEAEKTISREKQEIMALVAIAKDDTASKEAKERAIKRLNEISPKYLGFITSENIKTQEATNAVNKYISALERQARAKVYLAKMEKAAQDLIELDEKSVYENGAGFWDNIGSLGGLFKGEAGKLNKNFDTQVKIWRKELIDKGYKESDSAFGLLLQEKINKNLIYYQRENEKKKKIEQNLKNAKEGYIKEVKEDPGVITGDNSLSSYNIPTSDEKPAKAGKGGNNDNKANEEKERQKRLSEELLRLQQRSAEEKYRLLVETEKDRIELLKDGYGKELELLVLQHNEEIHALEKQRHTKEEYAKIEEIIQNKSGKEKEDAEAIKQQYQEEDISLSQRKLQKAEIFNQKLLILDKKYELKKWEEKAKAQDEGLKVLQQQEADILNRVDSKDKAKAELSQLGYGKAELDKIKSFEEGKQKIQNHFRKQTLKLHKEHLADLLKGFEKMDISKLTDEQKKHFESLKKEFNETAQALNSITAGESEGGTNGELKQGSLSSFGGNGDILGMTPEQWGELFTRWGDLNDWINKVGASYQAAQQLTQTYFNFIKANQEAELRRYEVAHERKKKSLQAQLDAGIISQQQFKHQSMAIENDFALKKHKLEVDAVRREKAIKIADAVSNTALAIMNVWSKHSGNPVMAGILTALVTGIGAIQVATIARQPLPEPPQVAGAEDGYYPVIRKQDGKLFSAKRKTSSSGIYNEPTMLVGEQGKNFPELVVSGRALKRIDPKLKSDFMNEVYRAEGFENGLYPAPTPYNNNDELMRRIITLLDRNNTFLENLEKYGVRGVFEKSARTGKDIVDMEKEYRRLFEKNKH